MELKLVDYIQHLDNIFFGVTRKQFMALAFEFAEKNNLEHRFNREKKLAGQKWVRNFLNRHHLSLRTPEQVSAARAMGFNPVQLKKFFDNLKKLYTEEKFEPTRIFNMDETGISTSPNKSPKVISQKGKREVQKIASADRGETITAVCCFSAAGMYVPPALIFKRKKVKPELTEDAPAGTLQLCSDSGFINSDLFMKWLEHFKNYVNPTESSPVLLLLDNHASHISTQAIEYCRNNFIRLLSIPPHSSHRVQPLDVILFAALKTSYAKHADIYLTSHPGYVITQRNVGKLFKKAYGEVATVGRGEKGFEKCGIFPYDLTVFDDIDFLPAEVTYSE